MEAMKWMACNHNLTKDGNAKSPNWFDFLRDRGQRCFRFAFLFL
jgi:hypothetical protein